MSADCDSARGPDLCHPQLYKYKEAKWKQQVSKLHREFCGCNNFLDHFKWPGTALPGGGDAGEGSQDGGDTAGIGGLSTTGGGGGDSITDMELLR
ncbi:ORF2 [Seal anellovirus 2]|uniref:ORF2 n=1 Tax=Seal anellovirus 2 TaxID=1427157 RepID=V5NF43_9VIRU|nr:ORF2 [Seal anellovirus 2]AHA86838.1 ORF2 [Seal anellovirus 2]